MDDESLRDQVRSTLLRALQEAGLEVEQVGADRWVTQLSGEHKRSIPVLLVLDERSLKVASLLARAPDEGHEEVYRVLLRRNRHPLPVHFAIDDDGDLVLRGALPLVAVDERAVDELLGTVLALCDETFNEVLRVGFAGYLDAEQRWRAKVGLPPNPVGDAEP